MQLNVNLKIMKREQHESQRKDLHLASVRNTKNEVQRQLREACNRTNQAKILKSPRSSAFL